MLCPETQFESLSDMNDTLGGVYLRGMNKEYFSDLCSVVFCFVSHY
jgi:hypothetical protein